jgi:hypothetical protein
MTQAQERRKHPRLPLHLSVAKLVDFKSEGLEGTAPAVLVDLSAGGLSMICFALPPMSQNVMFRLNLPGIVNAQVHGRVVRVLRKGETYHMAVEFTELRKEWASMIGKLFASYQSCQERWEQGDRKHCPKECAYHKAFPREG